MKYVKKATNLLDHDDEDKTLNQMQLSGAEGDISSSSNENTRPGDG